MEVIKFRAYDELVRRMYEDVQTGVYEDPDGILDFGTIIGLYRFKIIQYVGIKDNSGIEAYEKDIIQLKNGQRWIIEELTHKGLLMKWCKKPSEFFLFSELNTEKGFDIIGNVFENENLLKQP